MTVLDLEISIIFKISSVVYNLVMIPMNLSRHLVPVLGRGGMGRAWARVGAGPGPGVWAGVWAEAEVHRQLVVVAQSVSVSVTGELGSSSADSVCASGYGRASLSMSEPH